MQTVHVPLYAIRHSEIGGTEFAVYNLVKGLAAVCDQVKISYGRDSDLSQDFLQWARDEASIVLHRGGGLPGSKSIRFLEESLFQVRRTDPDWAIFPNYFCPPALGKARKSSVILHDVQYKCYPEYHTAKRRAWLDFYLTKLFRTADAIILISESERALVREHFGEAAAARCDVVYNAIDFQRLEQPYGLARETVRDLVRHPYVLSVCHQFPHKNIVTLLKAFEQVARRDPALRLYLVGSASDANMALVGNSLPPAIRDRVHITGFVSDVELGLFYTNARLFVLPSLYEGFGMPAIEALGLGVPTLVSNVYALPEVTLGYAGLIDDPLKAEAWAAAIETAIASCARPSPEQIAHVRTAYHPTTIAGSVLSVLHARQHRRP